MPPSTPPRSTPPSAPRRKRITPEREANLYTTVVDMLQETGYDALTIDAVAARAGWSKATLYRYFSGKQKLVSQALSQRSPLRARTADTGSLAGDLHALAEARGDEQLRRDAALMRGLLRVLHSEGALAKALRVPGTGQLNGLIARAVARGELAAHHPATRHLPHLLIGVLVTHPLVEGGPADRAFLHSYIDAVILPALGIGMPSGRS
jgi:AcrR family transcriptional regulator